MTRGLLAALAVFAVCALPAAASTWSDSGHQWKAHAPFTVRMVDQTTGAWPARVARAASEWSQASAVDVALGNSGKVAIQFGSSLQQPCAYTNFDLTGQGQIKSATIVLRDGCMASWSEDMKQFAICNEMGHALGMPDYRTDTPVIPSCMAPSNWGPSPSQDDYDELALLYGG
jgi:hypothetical protein